MATTAVSSTDVALIRNNPHTIPDVTLDIVAPQTVASLTVTAIPSAYPFVNLTVSGSMADVLIGQLLRVTSGTIHKTWGVVRKAPAGSTLYITPVSLGDPGFPERIESAIAVSDTVTVYSHHAPFGLYSTIRSKVFYKQWDVAYSDQNSQPPPVANAGVWQRADIAVAGTASFTLPKGGSNSSFALGSATISSYLWTLPTGVSLQGGYATSDAVIAVDATVGQHLVSLKVTDSNAKTHTAYVWLFVADGSTYTSFGDSFGWAIDGDSQSLEGREQTITVYKNSSMDDLGWTTILPGAGVLFTVTSEFGSSSASDGVLVDTFIGYVTDSQNTHTGEYGSVTLTVQAPYLAAKQIVIPPQLLKEVTTPANWTECTSVLSNPRGALYYAMKWHCPTLLDMHDLDAGSLTTPRRKSYEYNVGNVADAMKVAAQNIVGNVGSASDGTTVLRQNPNYEDNTFRNALAVVWTWAAQDLRPPLRYPRRFVMPTGELRSGGFAYDGSNIGAWAAIKRWYQGAGKTTLPDFSVTSSEGLTRVKEVVGHAMAVANTPTPELRLDVNRNIDIAEPVYMLWHYLTVSSAYDPRGDGWTNQRGLITHVDRTWEDDAQGLRCTLTNSFQPETYGQPGEELPIGSASTSMQNGWYVALPVPYQPNQAEIPALVYVLTDEGGFARTFNFHESNPTYTDISAQISGTVCDLCWDYNSTFFTSGGEFGTVLSLYVCAVNGTSLYVYRYSDARDANPTVTLLTTYTMNDSSCDTTARMQCSKTTPTFAGVAWKDQTGTLVGRTEDGGTTWETAVRAGSSVSDTGNDDAQIGFMIEGVDQLVTAPDGSLNYGVYYASAVDGAYSALANTETSPTPVPVIIPNWNDDVWVGVITAADYSSPDYDTDYDGGYSTYSHDYTTGAAYTFSLVDGTGNPSNCAHWRVEGAVSLGPGTRYLEARIDLGSNYTAYYARADIRVNYYDIGNGGETELTSTASSKISFLNSTPTELSSTTDSNIGDITVPGSVSNGYFEDTGWLSRSHEVAGGETSTRYVYVRVEINHPSGSLGLSAAGDYIDIHIDNIEIWVGASPGNASKIYRVNTYADTDSWTDLTPNASDCPRFPYALGVDLTDENNIEAGTVADDDTNNWNYTINDGSAWTTDSDTTITCVKRIGNLILYGGAASLGFIVDGDSRTTNSRTGNITTALNDSSFNVKNMVALL